MNSISAFVNPFYKGRFVRVSSLIVSALLLLHVSACTNKNERIAKKWNVIEMNIADQVISGETVANFTFELRANGTYQMHAMTDEEGTWSLSKGGDTLYTLIKGATKPAGSLLKELTDDKMIIEGNSEGATLKITFVPASK